MTLSEIARMERQFLTPKEVAPILGCDQYWINLMAKSEEGRKKLGFKVVMIGCRVKVPKIPFLRFMGWEGQICDAD